MMQKLCRFAEFHSREPCTDNGKAVSTAYFIPKPMLSLNPITFGIRGV
jgi:hypothetical protein